MQAWDLTLTLPNKPGELARFGEEMGKAHVNIEGLAAFEFKGMSYVHVLVEDHVGARRVVEQLGHKIELETEVLVERVDNKPGMLGEYTRSIADEGINLTTCYLATDTRLVLGATDFGKLESAWHKTVKAVSR